MNEVDRSLVSRFTELGLGAPARGEEPPDSELGQSEFFELLVTQLSNQDPLNPTDSDALLAQLAQFSTVDGIQRMESAISDLVANFSSNQALQASTIVGRNVIAASDSVTLGSEPVTIGVREVPDGATSVVLQVLNSLGQTVREFDLGGGGDIRWDGRDQAGNTLAPGSYGLRALSTVDGETQAAVTVSESRVESVSLSRNPSQVLLNLENEAQVPLNQVEQIS